MQFFRSLSLFVAFVAINASAQITMNVDATKRGPFLNPYQYGLFFEEINHAGDGGLYAELVKNRSFDEALDGWQAMGATLTVVENGLLNNVQRHALQMDVVGANAQAMKGVANKGFWGMNVVKDSTYSLSFWAKGPATFTGTIVAQLRDAAGQNVIGQTTVEGNVVPDKWNKLSATISATGTDAAGQLVLLTSNSGRLTIDVVSLFPYTWKNRSNGMRPDLAQLLADIKPSFLRFPGGCYVEGEGSYEQTFQWKKTIGPIEQRPGHMNQNWRYWSSDGLGFDEYLQLCEDLDAAPLFVVNIGLGHGYAFTLEETKQLVQDCLDAIEYANGDATTEWGAKRIANGHVMPYGLKFIEIGNENYNFYSDNNNDQSWQYAERYKMFYDAIKAKYPDIVTIGNVESWGTDNPTWRNEHPVELVDEHYYRSHSWMKQNYNKYDAYPRTISVYNGEYAANEGGTYGRYGNMNSALGEAVYMLGMERNSDVCRMASFAPIFTHEMDPRWPYDMIHFKQGNNFVTPSYHVQRLMSSYLGYQNLVWTETGNFLSEATGGSVGVGTWNTQAIFDDIRVTDLNGNELLSQDFTELSSSMLLSNGDWAVNDGSLTQTAIMENSRAVLNVPLTSADYIYNVRAKKTGGNEGFLIIFDYQDPDNYIWWNIAGWNNTQHGVERCVSGAKTTLAATSGSIDNDRWYDIQIRKEGNTVKCLLDGQTVHEFTIPTDRAVYQSLQLTEAGDKMLLKVVNPSNKKQKLVLKVKNMTLNSATIAEELVAGSGLDENTMDQPDVVSPAAPDVYIPADNAHQISLELPAYSLRIFYIDVDAVQPEAMTGAAYEAEDADKAAYLYAHMHTTQEISCFALSCNGQYWRDLFDSQEAFPTKDFTTTGGMRDAFVCRTQSGKFLLAGTDMTSRLGWTSNHRMTFMHSNDLVHWDKWISIDLESDENLRALGLTKAEDMTAAWAPQIIYDPVTQKYVAYYSVGFPDRHRIFYSLFNEDLTEFSEPRVFYDPGFDVIDADIVWNDVMNKYVMVFKREGDRALSRATADYIVPRGENNTGACQWTLDTEFGIDEPGQSIEAPSQFRYIGSKRWQLGYQKYSGGYNYRIMSLNEEGGEPMNRRDMQGSVAPQHGSFVMLTQAEYDYLLLWENVVKLKKDLEPIHAVLPTATGSDALAKASDALDKDHGSFSANAIAMKQAFNALNAALVETPNLNEHLLNQARQGLETDLTPLIRNADFSKGGEGWDKQFNFTQANGSVAEYWNTFFDFSQRLMNLPKGSYEASVQSFYREGSINNAAVAHFSGLEHLNASFYVNNDEKPVMSLFDQSVQDRYSLTPYTYPDNVSSANEAFNDYGLYTNTITLNHSGGDMVIGIRKTEHVDTDWCCFDNFRLLFKGPSSGTEQSIIFKKNDSPTRRYLLTGQQVDIDETPVRGIYVEDGRKIAQ